MKAKLKKSGSNGFSINLNCEHCGKPINRTSVHFGMDCEDGCAEKKYHKQIQSGSVSMENLMKLFL
jgi:hypothetical protein